MSFPLTGFALAFFGMGGFQSDSQVLPRGLTFHRIEARHQQASTRAQEERFVLSARAQGRPFDTPTQTITPNDSLAFAPLIDGRLRLSTLVDIPRWEALSVVRDEVEILVHLPRRLQGLVKIETEQEALGYVRLFSNPRIYYSNVSEQVLEIRATEDIDEEWFLGDANAYAIAKKAPEGYMGLVRRKTLAAIGVHDPIVKRVNGAFTIERVCMLRDSRKTGMIFLVNRRERVTADGTYQLLSEMSISSLAKAVDWTAPVRGY